MGPGIALFNPDWEEWPGSGNRIIQHTTNAGSAKLSTQKQKLSLDALIHACARNLFLPVCTNNLGDFIKLNRAAESSDIDHPFPIFTPEQVLASLHSDQIPVDPTFLLTLLEDGAST